MPSESAAYRFPPAGHEPPRRRARHREPDSKLARIFEQWLDGQTDFLSDYYKTRGIEKGQYLDILKTMGELSSTTSIEEAHSLLLRFQDHPNVRAAGLFLSAIYNRGPATDIVFDLDLENSPLMMGYGLPRSKIFINRTAIGTYESSSGGLFINYGKTNISWGHDTFKKTMMVNYGETSDFLSSLQGLLINLGQTGFDFRCLDHGIALNFGEAGSEMGSTAEAGTITVNAGVAGTNFAKDTAGYVIAMKAPRSFGTTSDSRLLLGEPACLSRRGLVSYLGEVRDALERGRTDYRLVPEALQMISAKRLLQEAGVTGEEVDHFDFHGVEWRGALYGR
ncbi:MAG: hypothetical protein HY520_04430 [Candidatus Aenigmarchaeota archaeon]|nr:hypothetical protein [Candidatus Aenigmarchaeota archaeon]